MDICNISQSVSQFPYLNVSPAVVCNDKGRLDWAKIVNFLKTHFTFAYIDGEAFVWVEKLGIYKLLTMDAVADMILASFGGKIAEVRGLSNIHSHLCSSARDNHLETWRARGIVPFADGDFLLGSGEFLEPSPERPVLSRLPYNLPTIKTVPALCKKALLDLADDDEDYAQYLTEVMAYNLTGQCWYPDNKCFIALGDDRSGKDEFLRLVQSLIGEENCVNLAQKELMRMYKSADLLGKKMVFCTDPTSKYLEDKVGEMAGRSMISVRGECGDTYHLCRYKGVAVFSPNKMPLLDESNFTMNRLKFVFFTHRFGKGSAVLRDLLEPKYFEGFVLLALECARGLYRREVFTVPARDKGLYEDFKEEAYPLGTFLKFFRYGILGHTPDHVYESYVAHQQRKGREPMAKAKFAQLLCAQLNLEVVRKKNKEGEWEKVYARRKR